MLGAIKLEEITKDTELSLKTYYDCLKCIMCNVPTSSCHLEECKSCSDEENIKNHLRIVLDDHFIEKLAFQIWQHMDRRL